MGPGSVQGGMHQNKGSICRANAHNQLRSEERVGSIRGLGIRYYTKNSPVSRPMPDAGGSPYAGPPGLVYPVHHATVYAHLLPR
jgi:hypothetical protein